MLAALLTAALTPSVSIPQPARLERSRETLPNGWTYSEPVNNCVATRTSGRDWMQLHLTRWDDLSDSILFYRPGLPPLWSEENLPTGRTPAQEEADADAYYHLDVRIDGRPVETFGGFNAMIVDYDSRPGPTYRFGIRQQPFLRALARGRTLELFHRGRRLVSMPINNMAATARRMAACVALPPRAVRRPPVR
jgi:hypothetical protein